MPASLLNRQLATITKTLATASERRKADLQDSVNRPAKVTPLVHDYRSEKATLIAPWQEDEDAKGAARVGHSEGIVTEIPQIGMQRLSLKHTWLTYMR